METQAQSLRMAEAQFEQEKRKRAEEMQAAKEKYDASVRVRRNAHMEAAALHRENESERRSGFFEEQTRREEALCADKKAHEDDLNEKQKAWSGCQCPRRAHGTQPWPASWPPRLLWSPILMCVCCTSRVFELTEHHTSGVVLTLPVALSKSPLPQARFSSLKRPPH